MSKKSDDEFKVGIKAYVSLIVAILFFSGLFYNVDGKAWLGAFDFTSLSGKFGTMLHPEKNTFVGEGGNSARAGFIFALSLIPTVMLA